MDIKHELKINAAPQQIFNAISTRKGIKGWWAINCKVNCNINQESTMTFVKEDKTVVMNFITKEKTENKNLKWFCNNNGNPVWINSILNFEIKEKSNGSILVFTHSTFDDKFKDHPAYKMTVDGWNFFMKSLKSFCETGKGQPWA